MARVSSPLHVCWPQRERRGTTLPNPSSVPFPAGVPLTLSPPASRSRDRQSTAQPGVSPPTARIGGRRQRPPRQAASYWHGCLQGRGQGRAPVDAIQARKAQASGGRDTVRAARRRPGGPKLPDDEDPPNMASEQKFRTPEPRPEALVEQR
ncbi:PREDICTED: uncharacterized protein LOC105599391 isoform X2 [Cercocebus atys]|uniref:uncharacterized protein LOC105599391 isoform X2 n=1 Tax=Cercocebus atys TaxID=9531 RepID=UPI0005F41708|nr:PREDICTED: uncharacterized protein LOC105599391 isoform X2 [Cercocebus atys]